MARHIHIYLNKTKDKKEKTPQDIIDYMVKHGSNKIDAEKLVKKHFNYVVKQYSNSPVSKMAEVIGYLSMHDKKAKDTDYSKWYNAELAQELRWDVKTYPKGMKVKARRGDKSGNWIVDFPDGTRNGMREAELKFNEPVKDSTEGSLFHAGHMDKKSKDAGIIGTLATAQRDLTRISADLRALSSNEHVLTNRFSVDKAAGATRTALEAVEAAIKANPR
jgi:hypothetical protein